MGDIQGYKHTESGTSRKAPRGASCTRQDHIQSMAQRILSVSLCKFLKQELMCDDTPKYKTQLFQMKTRCVLCGLNGLAYYNQGIHPKAADPYRS